MRNPTVQADGERIIGLYIRLPLSLPYVVAIALQEAFERQQTRGGTGGGGRGEGAERFQPSEVSL